MSIRLMHVVDEASPEDGIRLLSLLLRRLPASEIEQELLMIGRPPPALVVPPGVPVHRIGRRFGWGMAWGVDVMRVQKARQAEAMHAWGMSAGTLAGMADSPCRISVTIADPAEAHEAGRWWRGHEPGFSGVLVCSAQLVQQRLIEAGIPREATLVIRPGVDFGAIRAAKERVKREDFGLPAGGRVLLTASPPSRNGGQFLALWATAILHQIWPDVRVLVPGTSREQQRLLRMGEAIYCPEAFVFVGDRHEPAELLAISDALVMPAMGDIAIGWLAWAMAASVPVIGAAVPAVAECIADRQNGFLCRPSEVHTLAIRIRLAFDAPEVMRQCVETARGQAYDVFRAEACVDQYLSLFRNLMAGRPAGENVRDRAMNA